MTTQKKRKKLMITKKKIEFPLQKSHNYIINTWLGCCIFKLKISDFVMPKHIVQAGRKVVFSLIFCFCFLFNVKYYFSCRLVQTVLTVVHGNLFNKTGGNEHPAFLSNNSSAQQYSANLTDPGRCSNVVHRDKMG